MLKRLFTLFNKNSNIPATVVRVKHEEHQLNTRLISNNALKVIQELHQAGYLAYLVGGGVRDLLLEGTPKDFDVATSATPEEVKKCFRQAMIIGKRFRIVHVRFGREIIEVTTFRAHHQDAKNTRDAAQSASGILLRDNVYGDIQSDALRRDFTVNALYYELHTNEVLDFSTGLEDLQNRTLRIIGSAPERYREDPVRMLRAIRFAAKLGFKIDSGTAAPIAELGTLLDAVPSARRFEEVLKLLLNGYATATMELLQQYNLLQYLFPGTDYCLKHCNDQEKELVSLVAVNTDKRIRQNKRITPAFIYAVYLWLPLQASIRKISQDNPQIPPQQLLQMASQGVISQQLQATALPKRFLIPMREIWQLQSRLEKKDARRASQLMEHPRFRAAYDFLLLREDSGEQLGGAGHWWTKYQEANEQERQNLALSDAPNKTKKRRNRRRRPRSADQPKPQQGD